MSKTPEQEQIEYQAQCTHYRKGHLVYLLEPNTVVFDGLKATKLGRGINQAKRWVKENVGPHKCFKV